MLDTTSEPHERSVFQRGRWLWGREKAGTERDREMRMRRAERDGKQKRECKNKGMRHLYSCQVGSAWSGIG